MESNLRSMTSLYEALTNEESRDLNKQTSKYIPVQINR